MESQTENPHSLCPRARYRGTDLPPWACAQWKETRKDYNVLIKSVNLCQAGTWDNSLLWNPQHRWEARTNPPVPIKANGLRSATSKFAMNFTCACSHLFSHLKNREKHKSVNAAAAMQFGSTPAVMVSLVSSPFYSFPGIPLCTITCVRRISPVLSHH